MEYILLSNWYVSVRVVSNVGCDSLAVYLHGYRALTEPIENDGELCEKQKWRSGQLLYCETANIVKSIRGTRYMLVGQVDDMEMERLGWPEAVIIAFMDGFPRNWMQMIYHVVERACSLPQLPTDETRLLTGAPSVPGAILSESKVQKINLVQFDHAMPDNPEELKPSVGIHFPKKRKPKNSWSTDTNQNSAVSTSSWVMARENCPTPDPELWQRVNEGSDFANEFEEKHVHQVYENIAHAFSQTRYKPWPVVEQFVFQQPFGSVGADIGCGNGKNMGIENELSRVSGRYVIGCDNCMGLLEIAHPLTDTKLRGHGDCVAASNLSLPFRPQTLDFAISIAVLHHFVTRSRRLEALEKILNCLKTGGQCLIFVWALEQELDSKRRFNSQEVFVDFKVKRQPAAGVLSETSQAVKNQRYYHMFKEGELAELVESTSLGELVKVGYDKSNWFAIVQRV